MILHVHNVRGKEDSIAELEEIDKSHSRGDYEENGHPEKERGRLFLDAVSHVTVTCLAGVLELGEIRYVARA
jgi:hypothetical protein